MRDQEGMLPRGVHGEHKSDRKRTGGFFFAVLPCGVSDAVDIIMGAEGMRAAASFVEGVYMPLPGEETGLRPDIDGLVV